MRIMLLSLIVLFGGCITPYGQMGITGGAREKQISDNRFLITAATNGFSPPALLKPLMLKRARDIGLANGYASFQLEAVEIRYDPRGNGYIAQGLVSFSNLALIPRPGTTYVVKAPDPYHPSADSIDTSLLAKLKGSNPSSDALVLHVVPVFLDAVSTTYGVTFPESISFLKPGDQKFFVHFWFKRSLFSDVQSGFIPMERHLPGADSYQVMTTYKDGLIDIWVENEANKSKIGSVEQIGAQ
jgi:hypothetical protein